MYEDIFGLDNLLKAKEQEGIEEGKKKYFLSYTFPEHLIEKLY